MKTQAGGAGHLKEQFTGCWASFTGGSNWWQQPFPFWLSTLWYKSINAVLIIMHLLSFSKWIQLAVSSTRSGHGGASLHGGPVDRQKASAEILGNTFFHPVTHTAWQSPPQQLRVVPQTTLHYSWSQLISTLRRNQLHGGCTQVASHHCKFGGNIASVCKRL